MLHSFELILYGTRQLTPPTSAYSALPTPTAGRGRTWVSYSTGPRALYGLASQASDRTCRPSSICHWKVLQLLPFHRMEAFCLIAGAYIARGALDPPPPARIERVVFERTAGALKDRGGRQSKFRYKDWVILAFKNQPRKSSVASC